MDRRTFLGAAVATGAAVTLSGSTTLASETTPRTVRIGPFLLVNPPAGQEQVIRAAIEAIDFPWQLLDDVVADDSDRAVLVEWDDTGQGVSGLFWKHSLRIVLTTRSVFLDASSAFVFTHEVGHLIDHAVLDDDKRARLLQLLHVPPFVQIGHYNHDHPDAGHVSETWVDNTNSYTARLNEAFADLFVATFAPTVWDGTVLPGAAAHWPRFVHWTSQLDVVRAIVLDAATPEPDPAPSETTRLVPKRHPHPRLWGKVRKWRRRARRRARRIRRLRRRLRRRRRR